MNEKSQSELDMEVIDLGDAKELTMGDPVLNQGEDNPEIPGKL